MKKKRFGKNKKATGLLALALAGMMALGGSLAYFTDRETVTASAKSGSFDIELDDSGVQMRNERGQDIYDPGDTRQMKFVIKNNAAKSADTRERIYVYAKHKDGTAFPMTDENGQAEFELYNTADISKDANGCYVIKDGAAPLSTRTFADGQLLYEIPTITLSGKSSLGDANREIETDTNGSVLPDQETEDYTLLFRKDADNKWQDAVVTVEKILEAKQHRNTQDVPWKEIEKKTYKIHNNVETGIDVTEKVPKAYLAMSLGSRLQDIAGGGNKIKHIVWTETPPAADLQDDAHNVIDTTTLASTYKPSDVPVYATYNASSETIALYSEAKKVNVNNTWAGNMFNCLGDLEDVDVSRIDTSNAKDLQSTFFCCQALKQIKGLDTWDTSNTTNMSNMFYQCWNLETLDLTSFNTSKVTDMSNMFDVNIGTPKTMPNDASNNTYVQSLRTIYASDLFVTDNVTNDNHMFEEDGLLVGEQGTSYRGELSALNDDTYTTTSFGKSYAHIDGGKENPGFFTRKGHDYKPVTVTPSTDKHSTLLDGPSFAKKIGSVNNMTHTYPHTLSISWTDTLPSRLSDAYIVSTADSEVPTYAFLDPETQHDALLYSEAAIVTANTNCDHMFDGSSSACDFMNGGLFYKFDVMDRIDTSKVTSANQMFASIGQYGGKLEMLDLSHMDISSLKEADSMFTNDGSLKTIYVNSKFDLSKFNSPGMFGGSQNLVGGQGTTPSQFTTENPFDAKFAHIDGGKDNPGYFTLKE